MNRDLKEGAEGTASSRVASLMDSRTAEKTVWPGKSCLWEGVVGMCSGGQDEN